MEQEMCYKNTASCTHCSHWCSNSRIGLMQNKRGIRQNGRIHSQNQTRRELNAEGLVLTQMYCKYKSCTGNDNVRGVRTVPVAWLRVECVSLKGITIIGSEQGVGENERWNLREMEYGSEGAEAIEADKKRRQVAAKESVLQPKLLFHFWMSSHPWEATNKAPEFSFLTNLVCQTVFILLLSLVKWFFPLSLVIFPTASHAHTFPQRDHQLLIEMLVCFSKAAHSSALLSCRRAAVASQPCCVGQRRCKALSHTQAHTGNIAVYYTQSPAAGGEEITWL